MSAHATADAIALGVRQLANEHGLPNRFSAEEIGLAAGIQTMTVGRYLSAPRSYLGTISSDALEKQKLRFVAYGPGTIFGDRRKYLSVEEITP